MVEPFDRSAKFQVAGCIRQRCSTDRALRRFIRWRIEQFHAAEPSALCFHLCSISTLVGQQCLSVIAPSADFSMAAKQLLPFAEQPRVLSASGLDSGVLGRCWCRPLDTTELRDGGIHVALAGKTYFDTEVGGLSHQRVSAGASRAPHGLRLPELPLDSAELAGQPIEETLAYEILVTDCAQEVGQHVLDRLWNERFRLLVEQVSAVDDLVLRLKAEEERVTNAHRYRGTSLPLRGLVRVVCDPQQG